MHIAGAIVVTAVAAQSLGLFGGGSPTIVSPLPYPFVLAVFSGVPSFLLPPLVGLAFVLWDPRPLLRTATSANDSLPRRTYLLVAAVALLSGTWFSVGWTYGVTYQGYEHIVICAAFGAVLLIATILQSWVTIRSRNRAHTIATHVILFAWASSYAFPYLGELC